MSRQTDESRRTVLVALGANAAITVVKLIGGVVSGSSALMAEAAHSIADTANQGFLLTSLSRAERAPDEEHPFGYGQERFFWAFLAAIGIFVAGAGFSVYQGLETILGSGSDSEFTIAYAVLAFAFVAEGISLLRALRQTRGEAEEQGLSVRSHIRRSRDPTTRTVVFEDSAAVTGNVVAGAGVALHQITGDAAWEGVAALIVAAMLAAAALGLARQSKGLLIGMAALPDERRAIHEVLESRDEIDEVLQLLTMALGPDQLLVAARVDLKPGIDSESIERMSTEIDEAIRERVPAVGEVFLDATDRADRLTGAGLGPLQT